MYKLSKSSYGRYFIISSLVLDRTKGNFAPVCAEWICGSQKASLFIQEL